MQRPDDATKSHLNGYDKAVQRYLEHPRGALVRKFLSLQIKNILYYQAELDHLEKDLNDCIHRAPANASLPQHTIDLQTSWWDLHITESSEQWELFKKIRSTLTEYRKYFCVRSSCLTSRSDYCCKKPRLFDCHRSRNWARRIGWT